MQSSPNPPGQSLTCRCAFGDDVPATACWALAWVQAAAVHRSGQAAMSSPACWNQHESMGPRAACIQRSGGKDMTLEDMTNGRRGPSYDLGLIRCHIIVGAVVDEKLRR